MPQTNLSAVPTPWTVAYNNYWSQFNAYVLQHAGIRQCFAQKRQLPVNYGVGVDERCIEFPWYFSHASESARRVLDAGSALNYPFAVAHPYFLNRELTILTLAPEDNCFWKRRISYMFGDLRDLAFKDGHFDEICCISTIEHVGMNNARFTGISEHRREFDIGSFETALRELGRVLRRGGRLMVTVPFGRYENWGEFQQFDSELLDQAADSFRASARDEAYYICTPTGWQYTQNRDLCRELTYSSNAIQSEWGAKSCPITQDPRSPVAAPAVACCAWTTSG